MRDICQGLVSINELTKRHNIKRENDEIKLIDFPTPKECVGKDKKTELVSKNELCDKKLSDENIVSQNEKQMKIVNKIEDVEPAYKKDISMSESMNTNKRYEPGKIDKDTEIGKNNTKVERDQTRRINACSSESESYANILTKNLRIQKETKH